jgi:hypothetical protein
MLAHQISRMRHTAMHREVQVSQVSEAFRLDETAGPIL